MHRKDICFLYPTGHLPSYILPSVPVLGWHGGMHQAMDSLTFSLLGNLLRKVGKKYGGGGRGRYLHKKDICFCTLQAPCLLAFFLLSLCWGGTERCSYGFINPFPAGEFVLSALVPPEVSLKKRLRKPEPLILRHLFHTRWHKILELKQDVTRRHTSKCDTFY